MPATQPKADPSPRSSTYRLHEFDPSLYDWDDWEILLETYVAVEAITDDTKKRNLLITALGVQPFKTLIALCKPKKPTDYSFDVILQKLRSNYSRVTFASTERIKFFAVRQDLSISLTDFANQLRDKIVLCKFPNDFFEEALITAFVGGLKNEQIRKHLMQQNLETFEQTLNVAKIYESVLVHSSSIQPDASTSNEFSVMKIQKQHEPSPTNKHKLTCFSCGSDSHIRSQCRFRNVQCHVCKKTGHIAKVCRSNLHKIKSENYSISSIDHESPFIVRPIRVKIKIIDRIVDFEFDTGSPITIISKRVWNELGKPDLAPVKANFNSFSGHDVKILGQLKAQVTFNNICASLVLLVGLTNKTNILGRNWIHALNLNRSTLHEINSNFSILHVDYNTSNLRNLLIHYKDIFKEGLGCCKIEAHLHIKPNVVPKFCKARSLPFAYRHAVELELDRLVKEGVLEPISIANWAAPIVVVPKPGGKVRICADLSTGVNQALDIDKYPLPKPNDLFVALNGGSRFSKIDLSEAYLQVKLHVDSKNVLVINTHKGLFRYNRLPFGLASAPSIFQKIMDQMLAGLENTVCYLDDIIVTGKTDADHFLNLAKVFDRIQEYGFHINKNKCHFLQSSVEYLGFIVDKNGIHTSPSKTKALIDMPKPNNISQLRSFIGMVNHYAKFIPNLSNRLSPLYALLKKDTSWDWGTRCDYAFASIKQLLMSPRALTHYDPSLPLILAADASNAGVGAVIYHRFPDGTEKAIAHASKTLTQTESKYAQIEKEGLAIMFGIQKFDQFLRGRQFTLLTDHKPLISIFGSKKGVPITSANRLQRWAIRLMGYTFNIEYCSTNQFGQADGLSRLPAGADQTFDEQDPGEVMLVASIQQEIQNELPIYASQIAKATLKDPVLVRVHHYILSGWPSYCLDELQPYFKLRNELSVSFGCIMWGIRTVIPNCYRIRLLEFLHSTHIGMGRMKANARGYLWWPSLDKDIEDVARRCSVCTQNEKSPVKTPLKQWNVPDRPWQRIHIDFLGKFMGIYILIIVDAHSKWLEAIIMNNISSMDTIKVLTKLFARHGLCEEIVSDNGTQFTSDEFSLFCSRNGIRHITTAPGHPQSNGQAERYVDIVKSALKKGSADGGKLSDVLTKFLFCYRTTPHSTTNISPAELFLKRKLRTVLDLLRPNAYDTTKTSRTRYEQNFNRHVRERRFVPHDKVLVRDFSINSKRFPWTPGVLVYRRGSRLWYVKVGEQVWRRHENQIKHRYWSTSSDPTTTNLSVSSDHGSFSSTVDSPANNDLNPSRHSPRIRRPVRRLIEEI